MALRVDMNMNKQTEYALSRTSSRLDKGIEHLSSGLRINRPADNAAGSSIAAINKADNQSMPSENTAAAESKIRDTDMAQELQEYTKRGALRGHATLQEAAAPVERSTLNLLV